MEKSDSKIKTWEDLDEGEGKKRAERMGRRNYRSTRRYTISDLVNGPREGGEGEALWKWGKGPIYDRE